MIKRQRRFLNTEIFIELAKQIHGDKYDYSKSIIKMLIQMFQ